MKYEKELLKCQIVIQKNTGFKAVSSSSIEEKNLILVPKMSQQPVSTLANN